MPSPAECERPITFLLDLDDAVVTDDALAGSLRELGAALAGHGLHGGLAGRARLQRAAVAGAAAAAVVAALVDEREAVRALCAGGTRDVSREAVSLLLHTRPV